MLGPLLNGWLKIIDLFSILIRFPQNCVNEEKAMLEEFKNFYKAKHCHFRK